MRSNRQNILQKYVSVYLIVILMAVFFQESTSASSRGSQKGIVTSPDNISIHYTTYGVGSPTLVLVHGISCDQSYWREQVIPFSREFNVLTIDLAGHGDSGAGRKEWSMEA